MTAGILDRQHERSYHVQIANVVFGEEPGVWRGPITREEQRANRFAAFQAAELRALAGGEER